MKKNAHLVAFGIASAILLFLVAFLVVNFGVIRDIFVGLSYRPSSEMSEIREKLDLTGKGWRIFNASLPELEEREEFNQICRGEESENAVLGCYRDDRVYVYNVLSEELDGIREVTAAHELLHAVYDRMSAEERRELSPVLNEIYKKNQEILGEEIELYDDVDREEELFVRIGTEIATLPNELEKRYSEIFKDQDKIVGFYDGYITVFREIERKLKELLARVQELEAEIKGKTEQYEAEVGVLNNDISEFNNCAKTPNCFTSKWVFNSQRNTLISRQNSLTGLYNEINGLISEYNTLAAEYNENLLHGQALNKAINSNEKVEGISN